MNLDAAWRVVNLEFLKIYAWIPNHNLKFRCRDKYRTASQAKAQAQGKILF